MGRVIPHRKELPKGMLPRRGGDQCLTRGTNFDHSQAKDLAHFGDTLMPSLPE